MARRNDSDGEPRGNGLMIISGVIVLVVVLLGVFVVVTSDGGDGKTDDGASHASGSGASSSSGSTGDNGDGGSQSGAPVSGGCKPTDTDQKVPTTAPGDVTWSLAKTAALPRSKSAGPMVVNGLTASCYAHTPRGALLAAINTPYRVALAAPDKAPVEKLVLPGAGRDKLEAQLSQVDVQAGELSQVAGFRVVSYTPQTAVVTLVNGSADAHTLKSSDITVQWSDNDWKVVAREDGSLTTPATPVSDLLGYIQFGGL